MRMSSKDIGQLSEQDHIRLANSIMRRQAGLSLRVAAIFLFLLLGLPLFNYLYPEAANTPVLGFTATWLMLGVLFFPVTWLLSAYFVKTSDRIEEDCMDWRSQLGREAGEPIEPQGVDDIKPAFISNEAEVKE